MPRIAHTAHLAARVSVGVAVVSLLAGCWTTTSDESAPASSSTASAPATAEASPPAETPSAACPTGERDADSYECEGVLVTGAADEEPTIELADDFGPASELLVADVYAGEGDPVQPGATLTVQYTGVGEQSREIFDSSWASGSPATFGLDGVIVGWQEGLIGMQPGGRRLLVIPGDLAYGPDGYPPVIGEDETLVFVVDLIEAQPAG